MEVFIEEYGKIQYDFITKGAYCMNRNPSGMVFYPSVMLAAIYGGIVLWIAAVGKLIDMVGSTS